MQELSQSIENAVGVEQPQDQIREAGKKWACYALDTYRNDLLGKALAISKALSDFAAEMDELIEAKS